MPAIAPGMASAPAPLNLISGGNVSMAHPPATQNRNADTSPVQMTSLNNAERVSCSENIRPTVPKHSPSTIGKPHLRPKANPPMIPHSGPAARK